MSILYGLLGGAPKCLLGQLSGVLRASCCTSDPAAPSLGECDWSNPHRAALAGHSIESYVQTVHSSLPVYPRACSSSILSCPFLHAGPCNNRTLATAICGGRCVICAEATHFDNWSAGFCHFLPSAWNSLPVDLRDPGLSLLSFRKKTEDLSV